MPSAIPEESSDGDSGVPDPIGPPPWLRGLGIACLICIGAAVLLGVGLISGLLHDRVAEAGALFFTLLAILSGIAILFARSAPRSADEGRYALLSQALSGSPNGHLVVTPDGRIGYANAAFRRFFPDIDANPLGAIAERLEGDDARSEFAALEREAVEKGRANGRLPVRQSAGLTSWFVVQASLLEHSPGFSVWSFEDVTQRQEMEQVIGEEAKAPKPTDFLDSEPTGFYSVDGDGRFLLVDQTLADWFGVSPGDLVDQGAKLTDFLIGEVPRGSPPFAPFEGGAEGAQRGEVVLKGRGGRIIYAAISQSVVRAGNKLRTRSVLRDLTSEHEWAEALKQSRQRFQRLFANAPVGIALLSREGRIEEANRAFGELLGSVATDLIGKTLYDFVVSEDRNEVTLRLADAVEGRTLTRPVQVRLSTEAREKNASLFLSRLDTDAADEADLILHVIDITEQKNLEAHFAQSQKMQAVGQLAGGVAHDFNNLLTAMIGFCDLLLLRFRPGDPSFADLMQIKQNGNRAANLVRQLLAFSRKQTLQIAVLNITDILAEISHLIRRLIGEHIELKVVHGRDLGLVEVDQGQIEQVIINLAVNARDAMPSGGVVSIRTANVTNDFALRLGVEEMPPGTYVLIEVSDTGIGIPKENLSRIFEPFFSTKEIGSGTGLGLSTVYGIVKQSGGFVFVDSELGKGAVFSIYLPRAKSEEKAAVRPLESADAADDLTGNATILLVEDEDPVRLFSARALRNKGHRVIEAKTGEAAVEIIEKGEEKIDLVITDVVMPHMDGPGLVKEVRARHPDMKVIFISGYAEDSFKNRFETGAITFFLPKPYSLKQLAAKVKEVLGGPV